MLDYDGVLFNPIALDGLYVRLKWVGLRFEDAKTCIEVVGINIIKPRSHEASTSWIPQS